MSGALSYPIESAPEVGRAQEIVPGVKWLRLPLPFQLNHINVWLLRDTQGWTLIDSGIFSGTTRDIWHRVLESELEGEPLTRILVTHLHPDHVGCAGWLTRKFDIELFMSRDEYLLCRVLVADTGKPAPTEGIRFYRGAGFNDEAIDRYTEYFGAFGRVVSPLPEAYRRLVEGMQLQIGEHCWEVIIGRGHSPEHACLLCREQGLLISGDQILPTISSNVSVYPTEPAANPLGLWFESIAKLRQSVPADVLVLPAHGKPFHGAHTRLDALSAEHQAGLNELRALCRAPKRAVDVFPALFRSQISERNLIMATGEAISHLNYLVGRGEMRVTRDNAGVNWYCMGQ